MMILNNFSKIREQIHFMLRTISTGAKIGGNT